MLFFVFKRKTADELRISDWRSDVCSSDLLRDDVLEQARLEAADALGVAVHRIDRPDRVASFAPGRTHQFGEMRADLGRAEPADQDEASGPIVDIGRASCRESVCQYV